MKKIFNAIMAFAAAALLFSACEPAGKGVAFPKEPRIEYELDGYQAVIGEDASATAFILRWTNEQTASYKIYLGSLESEAVLNLNNTSTLVENDVREMKIKQSDLVSYAAQLGYEVTAAGVTAISPDVQAASSVSFRIYVAATAANGEEFTQPAIYTRYAPVTLVPQAAIAE